MRPIDADALERDLFDADWILDNDEHMVEDILRKQPTIDAVPVVRCKDCKYAHSENGIWYWCSTDKRKRPSSFYCSAGRKKDEYDD